MQVIVVLLLKRFFCFKLFSFQCSYSHYCENWEQWLWRVKLRETFFCIGRHCDEKLFSLKWKTVLIFIVVGIEGFRIWKDFMNYKLFSCWFLFWNCSQESKMPSYFHREVFICISYHWDEKCSHFDGKLFSILKNYSHFNEFSYWLTFQWKNSELMVIMSFETISWNGNCSHLKKKWFLIRSCYHYLKKVDW